MAVLDEWPSTAARLFGRVGPHRTRLTGRLVLIVFLDDYFQSLRGSLWLHFPFKPSFRRTKASPLQITFKA